MKNDVETVIREYLPNILHMSLATCVNNKPWVCEVHFVYDDELSLYWRSQSSRRHSQEIAQNPHVAADIVVQHGPGEAPQGIYLEGLAEELKDVDENNVAYQKYCERLGTGPEILEDAKQEDGHKFYKLTVSDWYVFDARESKPSTKYHLSWKKSSAS